MKVLMLSTDKNILDKNSGVSQRVIEYSRLVEKLDILLIQKSDIFSAIKRGKKFGKPDLITSQDPFEIGLIGWRLAKHFGCKLQLQIHTDFLSPYFKKESFLNKVRVCLAKFLIPKADCIRVVSKRIENSLRRITNNELRITVLPIFVDVEKIKNSLVKTNLHKKYPQFDFIILVASRLTKEKNIEMAIDVMEEIIKNYPRAGLVIVGDGPKKEALKAISHKLKANIIFENWTDDLVSYYKSADLFLLTSNYEGYGMTIVEAVSAGCNVLSTDVGVAGEMLGGKNIFAVGDKEALREKIEQATCGDIKEPKPLSFKTKERYLEEYKQSWTGCV